MTIAAGETILAADVKAIKDDVDKLTDLSSDSKVVSETTTSTSFTDLTTTGPSVTVTTGTLVLVIITAQISNDTSGEQSFADFDVSGATTRSASINTALQKAAESAGDNPIRAAVVVPLTVTAGSNTFTAKYRVTGGTGRFHRRTITVLPIGA